MQWARQPTLLMAATPPTQLLAGQRLAVGPHLGLSRPYPLGVFITASIRRGAYVQPLTKV
jgi:hypothetical protein